FDPLEGQMLGQPSQIGRLLCFDQVREVVGKHRTEKLTARRSVYNHFSLHKQKCRSALTERH
ncbi:hypothetical protein, partial [Caballeronia sp. LZ028]|uniref:hypothetical protein n=1 Tax=Caballeronia sp. LZ028 TaxID=3038563 RepID=UPI00285496E8